MDYIILFVLAFVVQFALNFISKKINYDYSTCYKWIAIFINMGIWYLLFERFHWSITFGLLALASTILLTSSLIDLTYQEIPNSYNLLVALLGVGFILEYKEFYQELLLSGVIIFVLFMSILAVTGAMGGGDVKMAGAIGLFLGLGLITKFIIISFFSGAIMAILLILFKKKGKHDVFAFGPYIAFAGIYLFVFYV